MCYVGDFNMPVEVSLKKFTESQDVLEFRDLILIHRLFDRENNGPPFTWANIQLGRRRTWERLDRGLCSVNWKDQYPASCIQYLGRIASDHRLLLLRLEDGDFSRPTSLHSERMWLKGFKRPSMSHGCCENA